MCQALYWVLCLLYIIQPLQLLLLDENTEAQRGQVPHPMSHS